MSARTVNRERIQLAVTELLTTDKPQGRYTLRSSLGYCCLGILTEVAIANGLKLRVVPGIGEEGWRYGLAGNAGILCQEVQDWYGFGEGCGSPELLLLEPRPIGTDGRTVDRAGAHHANDQLRLTFPVIGAMFAKTYLEDAAE